MGVCIALSLTSARCYLPAAEFLTPLALCCELLEESPCSEQPALGFAGAGELTCLGPRAPLGKCSPRRRDGALSAWVVAASTANRELLLSVLPSSLPSPYWLLQEKVQESVEKVSVCSPGSSLVLPPGAVG